MVKFNYNFYPVKKNEQETNLFLMISFQGNRLKFNMNAYRIKTENWNQDVQRSHKADKKFNSQLEYIEAQIIFYFENNNVINIEELKKFVKRLIKGEKADDLDMQKYLLLFVITKSAGTQKIYRNIMKLYFSEFVNISDFDIHILYSKFAKHKISTLHNIVAFGINFFNWVKENGYYDTSFQLSQMKKLKKRIPSKTKIQKSHLIALTESELEILFNADLPLRLQKYRDTFLLQCYTGQRYSDKIKINKNTIKLFDKPENNVYGYIELVSKKTKTHVKIPIHKKIYELLERNNFNMRFKHLSSENKYIKKVCELAGLTDMVTIDTGDVQKSVPKYVLISTHTARRTFITLMIKKGVTYKAIMEVSGIREINTIMNYQKLLKEESAQMIADAFS